MSNHRVVLFEGSEHGGQVRMSGLDRGKKSAVFAAMVTVECRTESVAVQQQITRRVFGWTAVAYGCLCDGQSVPQALVHAA